VRGAAINMPTDCGGENSERNLATDVGICPQCGFQMSFSKSLILTPTSPTGSVPGKKMVFGWNPKDTKHVYWKNKILWKKEIE
jgi:hypothetical protein